MGCSFGGFGGLEDVLPHAHGHGSPLRRVLDVGMIAQKFLTVWQQFWRVQTFWRACGCPTPRPRAWQPSQAGPGRWDELTNISDDFRRSGSNFGGFRALQGLVDDLLHPRGHGGPLRRVPDLGTKSQTCLMISGDLAVILAGSELFQGL